MPGEANHSSRARVIFVVVALLISACATTPRFEPFTGPLAAANQEFHRFYGRERDRIQQTFGSPGIPVIVAIGNHVTLMRNDLREQHRVVPPGYHDLKAVSHIPFGLFLLLENLEAGPLGDDGKRDILKFRMTTVAVGEAMPAGAPPGSAELIGRTLELLDTIIRDNDIETEQYLRYARESRSIIDDYADLAARIQLESLDARVRPWLSVMTAEERDQLRVVVGASHQARHRETSFQYFSRLLGEEPGPGASREDRLVYAEGIYDEAGALRLLAKHVLDQRASVAFFGDRFRLQEDMLSEGAERALRSMESQ